MPYLDGIDLCDLCGSHDFKNLEMTQNNLLSCLSASHMYIEKVIAAMRDNEELYLFDFKSENTRVKYKITDSNIKFESVKLFDLCGKTFTEDLLFPAMMKSEVDRKLLLEYPLQNSQTWRFLQIKI